MRIFNADFLCRLRYFVCEILILKMIYHICHILRVLNGKLQTIDLNSISSYVKEKEAQDVVG